MNLSILFHLGTVLQAIRDALAAFADVQVGLDELRRAATSNPEIKADLVRLEGDVKRIGAAFTSVKGLLRL